jgi:asparagine synthase (glutamine-hydrolysing)
VALGHASSREGPADRLARDEATGVSLAFAGSIFDRGRYDRLRWERREGALGEGAIAAVVLAAYLEDGIACVEQLDGQFAFALHDPRDGSLFLCRDRFGICPLVYAVGEGGVAFASEAKALFAAGAVSPRLDPHALLQTLHLWAPAEGRTAFSGVRALPAGTWAVVRGGSVRLHRYWALDLSPAVVDEELEIGEAAEELRALLGDAVARRLQGVGAAQASAASVGAYLSGGLDSSLICALAQQRLGGGLRTFAAAFTHGRYDEAAFQGSVATSLGTNHHPLQVENRDIGEVLPQVVEHAEVPMLRTAPAPLLLLSRQVREAGAQVVLSGEGADELFWGYDLFRETAIRSFWARSPGSHARPALFSRLYPYLTVSRQSPQLLRRFFGIGLEDPGAWDFSHRIRWANSGRVSRFLSAGFLEEVRGFDPVAEVEASLPVEARGWSPLARAQLLEMRTLLSTYLLSTQGERMLAGHGVEGRFPFLDRRVAEFAARLPRACKLLGLQEKRIVRRVAAGLVPQQVVQRQKFPYRAPIGAALLGEDAPPWARELLGRTAVDEVGIFDGAKVERLLAKLSAQGGQGGDADELALAAVATTQLLATRFLRRWDVPTQDLDAVEVAA